MLGHLGIHSAPLSIQGSFTNEPWVGFFSLTEGYEKLAARTV